jgi:SHQ1 protein
MVLSVMQSTIRRSLIYPYIRNFSFSIYIWEQVVSIIQNTNYDSIRVIIRCLLQVRNILNYSDLYYLGNKLYIDPYLIWIQKYSDTTYLQNQFLIPMAHCIQQHLHSETQLQALKHSLDLNLLQIEAEFYSDDVNVVVGDDADDAPECGSALDNNASSDNNSEDNESDDDYDNDSDDTSCSSRTSCSRSVSGGGGSADGKTDTPGNEPIDSELLDDVDAVQSGVQRLELLVSRDPNTDSHNTCTSRTNTKATALDDLLSLCTKLETLNTDVNNSRPLIQEVDE